MSNPDVITGEAPHRYASALLDLAEESRALKTVEKDIASFKAIFAGSEAIQSVAGNAVYASDEKAAALTAIAKKAGIDKKLSFHIARHTWATRALRKGISIDKVSKLMGFVITGVFISLSLSSVSLLGTIFVSLSEDFKVSRSFMIFCRAE